MTDSEDNLKRQKIEEAVGVDLKNSYDDVNFKIITNDGSASSAEGLIALKNIISRQLPKMPKEYIVRLIFDHRHYSLVICRGQRIIGGICYRPYFEQKFAEIAFCAISGSEQVKGFGTLLMNQLKHHVQKQMLEYFLTYADNYALGYFQKQGFSKNVVMPKERWVGFIKDYDGGTLMECYIHPTMDYLNVIEIVSKQRAFIYHRIKLSSRSHIVHPGIDLFREGKRLQPVDIPGVSESGWLPQHFYKGSTDRDRIASQNKLTTHLKTVIDKIRQILTSKQLKNSSKNIKSMTDLDLISTRLKDGDYYRNKEMLLVDIQGICKGLRESLIEISGNEVMDQVERIIAENLTKDINIVQVEKESS